jgi:ketosteroid isomerase-like protein
VSRENVEIVRRTYATGAFDRFEVEELVAPDCEFVNPPDAVEAGVRRGTDEIRAAFRRAAEVFDVSEHRASRLFDAGESVVAEIRFRARGRTSGAELEQDAVHTWTFRDGKVVRFEWGRNLDAALKAVGLEE